MEKVNIADKQICHLDLSMYVTVYLDYEVVFLTYDINGFGL